MSKRSVRLTAVAMNGYGGIVATDAEGRLWHGVLGSGRITWTLMNPPQVED